MSHPHNGSRPQFDHVNPALILRMQQVATSITVATDAIGQACRQIQALDPHSTSVERFAVAGQAFKDACDRLGPTVGEIQNIDESLAE